MDRATYKSIKKMNKEDMDAYLSSYYTKAYNAGVDAIAKTVTDKIITGLENTKGIGKKRMGEIIDNINKELMK